MSDLRERPPAHAVMEKLVSLQGTPDLLELPFGIIKISKEGLSWLRGVRGELKMAAQLLRLGPEWVVLHSVPVGNRGSDIDHLAIGPTGVFPINTKRLIDRDVRVSGDRFTVDGWKRDYLRNSDFEAARVETVLLGSGVSAPVLPVIAISGAKSITVSKTPMWRERSIGVAPVSEVVIRIRKRPVRLTPGQVNQLSAFASESSVWTKTSASLADGRDVRRAYDNIDRGVTRWNLLIATALLGAVAVAVICANAAVGVFLRLIAG